MKPKLGRATTGESLGAAGRSEAEILADAIAELQLLDAGMLQRRWRSLVGRPVPSDLGRPLMLRILAYKLQAQRLGDLDKASLRELTGLAVGSNVKAEAQDLVDPQDMLIGADGDTPQSAPEKLGTSAPVRIARPGTLLVREHGGVLHRVMVLDAGVTWDGRTYDSLSQVAFAITGTRWNGPRFFGLRASAKADRSKPQGRSASAGRSDMAHRHEGRGGPARTGRASLQRTIP
nr:DUF2924 domain-containing protein [Beijerinckia sp. L45]